MGDDPGVTGGQLAPLSLGPLIEGNPVTRQPSLVSTGGTEAEIRGGGQGATGETSDATRT